jgi:hypothetical protein
MFVTNRRKGLPAIGYAFSAPETFAVEALQHALNVCPHHVFFLRTLC